MKRICIFAMTFLFLMLFFNFRAEAQSQKEWLAIHPFQADKNSRENAILLEKYFRQQLLKSKYFYIKSSEEQKKLIAETQVEDVKAFEEGELEGAVQLGKRLQVSRLLTARVELVKNELIILDLSLVNVISGQELYQNTLQSQSLEKMKEKVALEVKALQQFANISGRILSINDEKLNTSFSKLDPIMKGQLLEIFRKQGQLLLPIGKAVITTILKEQSNAELIQVDPASKIKIGDVVKISTEQNVISNLGEIKIDVNTSWVNLEIDGIKQANVLMQEQSNFLA